MHSWAVFNFPPADVIVLAMEDSFFRILRISLQTELSHNLQQLSEKARSTTEFIQRLKGMSDKVTVSLGVGIPESEIHLDDSLLSVNHHPQESCMEFERLVHAQCEALIQAIHDRREYLLEAIRNDKDTKIRILKVGFESFLDFYIILNLFVMLRTSSRTALASYSRPRDLYSSASKL